MIYPRRELSDIPHHLTMNIANILTAWRYWSSETHSSMACACSIEPGQTESLAYRQVVHYSCHWRSSPHPISMLSPEHLLQHALEFLPSHDLDRSPMEWFHSSRWARQDAQPAMHLLDMPGLSVPQFLASLLSSAFFIRLHRQVNYVEINLALFPGCSLTSVPPWILPTELWPAPLRLRIV